MLPAGRQAKIIIAPVWLLVFVTSRPNTAASRLWRKSILTAATGTLPSNVAYAPT